MAATARKSKSNPRQTRARLTTKIRTLTKQWDSLKGRMDGIKAEIYVSAYEWVEAGLEEGAFDNVMAGCTRLASTLKLAPSRVQAWYYAGSFIRENRINPDTCDPRAVRALWNKNQVISKAERLKCISIIRSGKVKDAYREVRRVIEVSSRAKTVDADRKARALDRQNKLTISRLKLEGQAFRTMCMRKFGSNVSIQVLDDEGDVLLSVGAKPKKR